MNMDLVSTWQSLRVDCISAVCVEKILSIVLFIDLLGFWGFFFCLEMNGQKKSINRSYINQSLSNNKPVGEFLFHELCSLILCAVWFVYEPL